MTHEAQQRAGFLVIVALIMALAALVGMGIRSWKDRAVSRAQQQIFISGAPNEPISRKQVLDAILKAEKDYGGCNATFELTDVVLRMKAAK